MKILNVAYSEENLIEGLSKLFGTEFQQDWIGRLYSVINPFIQDGKYEPNLQIFSYTENGRSTDEYVNQYIMNIMNIVNRFIQNNNLFDMVTYEINKIDDYGNYLFIIKPVPYDDFVKYLKLLPIPLIIIIGLLILGIVML